jgi:filamentous hemagglutinin family protein
MANKRLVYFKPKLLAAMAFCSLATSIHAQNAALPTGGSVVAGAASISQSGNTMNIQQSSNRAVINWSSYNVAANAQVNYVQPSSSSVTLNRVIGTTPSQIDGAIRANGQVIFSNPNGITFGKGAQVDAAGVIATTLHISNKDFMDGKSTFNGDGKGAVVNRGRLQTTDAQGYIALLAPEVRNEGVIVAKGG